MQARYTPIEYFPGGFRRCAASPCLAPAGCTPPRTLPRSLGELQGMVRDDDLPLDAFTVMSNHGPLLLQPPGAGRLARRREPGGSARRRDSPQPGRPDDHEAAKSITWTLNGVRYLSSRCFAL